MWWSSLPTQTRVLTWDVGFYKCSFFEEKKKKKKRKERRRYFFCLETHGKMTWKMIDQWEERHVFVRVRLFAVTAKQREVADSLRKDPREVLLVHVADFNRVMTVSVFGEMGIFFFVFSGCWFKTFELINRFHFHMGRN